MLSANCVSTVWQRVTGTLLVQQIFNPCQIISHHMPSTNTNTHTHTHTHTHTSGGRLARTHTLHRQCRVMYIECAEKQMSLFLNGQTGSSDYIRKCNPTTVFSQLTEHAHALNIFYTHAMHKHKHTPDSMKTTACFELCAGFPRQILLIYVHSLLSVNTRPSVSFCREKKGIQTQAYFSEI